MKLRLFTLLLAICMVFSMLPQTVSAAELVASGSCGSGLTWELGDDGVLDIYGDGAIPDYTTHSKAPWYDYRADILGVIFEEGVTGIGKEAFAMCANVEEMLFAGDAPTIASNAFLNITATAYYHAYNETWTEDKMQNYGGTLTWEPFVHVVDSGTCGDDVIWELTEEGVLLISGTGAMEDYDYTSSVLAPWYEYREYLIAAVIDDGVTTIGNSAFTECRELQEIIFSDTVASIGDYAFEYCYGLTSVTIPDSVTSIGDAAFSFCENLASITIPNSVTSIGAAAFESCYALTGFTIPDKLTKISQSTFSGCNFTNITIPASVTEVGGYAFDCCYCLTEIVFKGDAPTIGAYSFGSVTATAYYPASGDGWTEDMLQNYGGTLTWEPYRPAFGSGTCGKNLTWELDAEGVLTISGSGAMYSYNGGNPPWYEDRQEIVSIVVGEGVTSIGAMAFQYCENVSSVTLPQSLTSIDIYAFSHCENLLSIDIPSKVSSIGNYAFQSCSSLTSFVIPTRVTEISNDLFAYCSNLTSIEFLGTITRIGTYAFDNCQNLTDFDVPDTVTTIGGGAFNNCKKLPSINIPDAITSIGESTFAYCAALTSIRIPDGVTSIGKDAFRGCSSLTSIDIPNGVAKIADGVFADCNSLTSITIPEGVTSIGSQMFDGCSSLVDVNIPDSVTYIGQSAFKNCSSLSEITIPDNVTGIDDRAFNYCTNLTGIVIPDSVTNLGNCVFEGCTSLTDVILSRNLKNLRTTLFADCTSLCEIIIPDKVTDFGSRVFSGCTSLRSIVLPELVESIGMNTFENCSSLKEITFLGDAPYFNSEVFLNVTASAYYHPEKSGWTDDVMQSYGGTITWKSLCASHQFDEWVVTTAPTCTQTGMETRTCSVCGKTETRELAALGHSFGKWVVTAAPTCTEKGIEARTCSVCEATETQEIEATGHSVSDWTVTIEPTCTEKGEETGTCATCGETVTRDVDALGHTMGEDCVDNEDGKTHTGTCTVCGALVEDDPHSFVDGFCEDCGAIALVAPELLSIFSREQTSCKATWVPVEGADGYELWRTATPEDEESWTRVKTIKDGAQDRYTNQGLEVGTTYYYKVRAFIGEDEDARACSEFSEVKYMPAAVVFNAPYSNSTFRIRLRWEEIGGADGYQIWRLNDDGTWGIVKTLGDKGNTLTNDQGATTAYSNTGLEAGKQYTYRMRAFAIPKDGVKVFGAYSDEFTVAVMPEAPEVTATSPKAGRAEVTWEAANGAAGYQVWMSESKDGKYKIIKSVTDGSTAYTKTGLTSGKTYYFKVRAYTEVNGKKTFGNYSQIVAVTVK